MPSDRSRTSDDRRQNYQAVVTQQGRVIVDRDFNAMQEVFNDALAADVTDIIGPCGTPDDGFKIQLEASGSPPTLWIPPQPLDHSLPLESHDFLIAPGTMFVGGQQAVFAARSTGQTGSFSYSYFDQPDWIKPPAPASPPKNEVISLHLFEQEVSAVEDPDLLDVALGGPDTTQRVRLMRRVERCPGSVCEDAAKDWSERGFRLDPSTMRLLPQVALQASYTAPAATTNPCDPVTTGGYLGACNQLIRVELRQPPGESPVLLWGYDNASFLYRVTLGGTTLTLAQAPVDVYHQPAAKQVVEVLRTAAVLAEDPNAATPGQTTLRCVAEARGFVTTLSAGYVAGANGVGTVVLNATPPLPPEYAGAPQLFLRVWQGQAPLTLAAAQPIAIGLSDFNNNSTGLQVALTFAGKAAGGSAIVPDGAFWMLAVRPATPQVVYPERFLESPQPPDGPHQWMCPLAVIDWQGGGGATTPKITDDCRKKFSNLVELTERERAGCCRATVGDGVCTFGDFTSINAAISSLPAAGGEVCILAGRYCEAVTISRRNVILHGCGPETRIVSPSFASSPPGAKDAGAVVTIAAAQVELHSLVIEADTGDYGVLVTNSPGTNLPDHVRLSQVMVTTTDHAAVWAPGDSVNLQQCTFVIAGILKNFPVVYLEGTGIDFTENWIGLAFATTLPDLVKSDLGQIPNTATFEDGLQIGGGASNVRIVGNEISGGAGSGITLGSVDRRAGFVVGQLAGIQLENNVIASMGQNGIGPVVLYDLTRTLFKGSLIEIVPITGLSIRGNQITNCPRLSFTPNTVHVASAAICLPHVAGLIIRDNVIASPGATTGSPVSGIYVYSGEQVEISRNQITDSRILTGLTAPAPGIFAAAGIYLGVVTPPASATVAGTFASGVPALSICDNVVVVGTGLTLCVLGFGAFAIRGNQFATSGILSQSEALVLAAGIFVLNSGSCLDALTLVADVFAELDAILAPTITNPVADAEISAFLTLLLLWLTIVKLEVAAKALGVDLAKLEALHTQISSTAGVGPGPVDFSQNRFTLSADLKSTARAAMAVCIATFDDLAFVDNLCCLQSARRNQVACNAFLFGMTTRTTASRFQETFGLTSLSCLAVGMLANISSLNIAPNGLCSSIGLQTMNAGNLPLSF